MRRWRLYYGDGTTYDDADGPPELAPSLNVQIIVQSDATVGRSLICDHDYYCWQLDDGDPRWTAHDLHGLWDYLTSTPGFKIVKFGRDLPFDRYRGFVRAAIEDPDFEPKSGWYPNEPRPEGA